MKQIAKAYNHEEFEEKIYDSWENSGYFRPEINMGGNPKYDRKIDGKPFVISMPPPNVTGKLHVGHSLFVTLQDIMTRYHRLKGEPTLWLPGTDHAGIATQTVVDKMLKKKGIDKRELGREKFIAEVWKWKEEYGGTITRQLRRMGASCDWSRERFTLDEGLNKAVRTAFVDLYNKGQIYQGLRVVNWCPRCHTAIADDEVEYKEQKSKLYWIKYGPFILATTRPETKLGDTAVAVSPKDDRYFDMVGKKYMIPGVLGEFEIIVVADNAVDPSFGSGAVKVTPAHSFTDYEIAQRNDLPMKQIIDENGRMMPNTGKYAGMTTAQAREAIVEDMEKMGLIDHVDEYDNSLPTCYRCGGTIEPIPSKQWFVKMKEMAGRAKDVVEKGEMDIIPDRFKKMYINWMENIRDWCISRQIWWGHQIPVWYRGEEIYCGMEAPDGEGWTQDFDVLDTWFSSALWPFSTLGWPDKSKDYDYFYPTAVMETGYDILPFWVARMAAFGLEFTDKVPFETVYFHGLVRDEHNRKMSKSLGNVLDPLDIIPKYGTDALRMALVVGSSPGQDLAVGESKIKGYRNFSNKIWNASRFVMLRVTDGDLQSGEIGQEKIGDLNVDEKALTKADREILKKHSEIIKSVTSKLDKYQFSGAGEELYEYFWHQFCDVYIESAKTQTQGDPSVPQDDKELDPRVRPEDDTIVVEIDKSTEISENTKKILIKILSESLILLHPFIPFVTEAVWQELKAITPLAESIMIAGWPENSSMDK
ncbi:MAG: valine--tRNA ligase [Patescibacteria group bacterium]